jgi:hypothetical protein
VKNLTNQLKFLHLLHVSNAVKFLTHVKNSKNIHISRRESKEPLYHYFYPFQSAIIIHKQSSAIVQRRIRLDAILRKIIKRQLLFLIGGTITGVIMTYYYGFLYSIIINSAIWIFISFIVNKYYYKTTGFKDEKYLLQYGIAMVNARARRT